ncbi:MAG: DNA-binding protein [Clostridia bacterium]|jgi:predicted DNA-binding protein with PD1-like motif|nr:DNA-binding protein [Clostridia bacterium]
MEYGRFGDTVLLRIDRGEEIIETVKRVAEKERIRLASVEALGAVDDFTVGVYDVAAKRYDSKTFTGAFEIVSLVGTITEKDGAFYQHLHMSAGNRDCEVFGGHLNRAVVSVTCEMVIRVLSGAVDRAPDPETGINLIRFAD